MSEIVHIGVAPSQLICPMGPLSKGRFPGVLAITSLVSHCGSFAPK